MAKGGQVEFLDDFSKFLEDKNVTVKKMVDEEDIYWNKHEYAQRSILSIADELLNLDYDIPTDTIKEEEIEFLDDKNCTKKIDKSNEEQLSLEIPEYETENSSLKEANGKIFKCQKCGETFKTKEEMILHKLDKHGSEVYGCKICAFLTTQKCYLKIHQSSVHEGKLYYCKQC